MRQDFLEMARIKSEFDIEKFTVRKMGPFVAHAYHMLMRQYSLTFYEHERLQADLEENKRTLVRVSSRWRRKWTTVRDGSRVTVWKDLEVGRLRNRIEELTMSIENKGSRLAKYEDCKKKLIEENGGKPITNEQYQSEVPKYWRWFLAKKAIAQRAQATTGIHEGVWENVEYLKAPALITEAFQVDMAGFDPLHFNMKKILENTKPVDQISYECE